MDSKRCKDCGEEKPLDQFQRVKARGNRPHSYCDACRNRRSNESHRTNTGCPRKTGPKPRNPSEHFWPKVNRGPHPLGCWLWTRSTMWGGYGRFNLNGSVMHASKAAWILAHGPVPDGMHVCHSCDNPPCCNPDHLFLGTARDNADDKNRKMRMAHVFTPQERTRLREMVESGQITQEDLIRHHGISKGTMYNIVHQKTSLDRP